MLSTLRFALIAGMSSSFALAGATKALAGCAVPAPVQFAPASPAKLPPDPTIYLFVRQNPLYGHGELNEIAVVDDRDTPIAYERETLQGTRDVQVLRLHVKAKRGRIVLRVRTGEGVSQADSTAIYSIDSEWHLPRGSGSTRIVKATYTYSEGCGASNGFVLKVKPLAPVYRVSGEGHDWVVPGSDGGGDGKLSVGEIYTGQIGCVDFAIPTDKPLTFAVTPLFPNGQEGETLMPGCRPSTRKSGLVCEAPVWLEFSGPVRSPSSDR